MENEAEGKINDGTMYFQHLLSFVKYSSFNRSSLFSNHRYTNYVLLIVYAIYLFFILVHFTSIFLAVRVRFRAETQENKSG